MWQKGEIALYGIAEGAIYPFGSIRFGWDIGGKHDRFIDNSAML